LNILITSAGRRTSLVTAFKCVASERGAYVVAADSSPLAPSLYLADKAALLPLVTDADYLSALERLCLSMGISLVVPTIDTELPILADARDHFAQLGITIAISDPHLIQVTGDKWLTVSEFAARGIRVPKSYLEPQVRELTEFPMFIKPRAGSASQHTYLVESAEDLSGLLERVPNPIIQEFLPHEEITIDVLLDLNGNPLHYVPRIRIRTLAGESIQGITLDDLDLKDFILSVLYELKLMGGRGPLTLQAFLAPEGPVLSEINPRFGGGVPLAFAAGGDYARWLIQAANGDQVQPMLGQFKRGLYMTRSFTEVFTDTLVT
jgi:carbamoyl-phosphate synthase large subunit